MSLRDRSDISLSKTRFMLGNQCSLALHRDVHAPNLREAPDAMARDLMEMGNEVHAFARHLHPQNSVEIFWESMTHEEADFQTQDALQDPHVQVIYEATFLVEDRPFRVDMLRRTPEGTWEIVETKATTSIEPHHIRDLAFQVYSLKQIMPVAGAQIAHLNRDYVYEGGEVDPWELFRFEDVTGEVENLQDEIRSQIERQREILESETAPEVEVGSHCNKPHTCPFHGACHDLLPKLPNGIPVHISQLAYLREGTAKHREFRERGVKRIDKIPEDMVPGLASSKYQWRQYQGIMTGEAWVDEAKLQEYFDVFRNGVHNFDKEWTTYAIPRYPGTRPFQEVYLQWSCSTVKPDGTYEWNDYLWNGEGDPYLADALALLEHFEKDDLPIAHWHTPEPRAFAALGERFPHLAERFSALESRCVDLLKIFKDCVYLPHYGKSYSEKSVLPAHVPGFDHSDLAVKDGAECMRWLRVLSNPMLPPAQREQIRKNVRQYNKRDTDGQLALQLAVSDELRALIAPHCPDIETAVKAPWRLEANAVRRYVGEAPVQRIAAGR